MDADEERGILICYFGLFYLLWLPGGSVVVSRWDMGCQMIRS